MFSIKFLRIIALATSVSAHFRLPYPGERNATNFPTQTEGPCGGSNFIREPRFDWNPKGSPLEINNHHTFVIGGIFFCEGNDCLTQDDFDVAFPVYEPFHLHPEGNFCIPAIDLDVEDGTNGTIQVIIVGTGDSAGEYDYMYNCVDVTVDRSGPEFDGQCSNSSSLEVVYLDEIDDIRNVTDFTLLDEYYSATKTATGSVDPYSTMAMSGMDMSGMDMGGSSTTMDMSGMDMGSSSASTATAAANGTTSASSTSSGLANSNAVSAAVLSPILGALCLFFL